MKRIYSLIFLLFALISLGYTQTPTLLNLPEGPYGGGREYDGVVVNKSSFHVVSTWQELKTALDNQKKDIYIEDNVIINVPHTDFYT